MFDRPANEGRDHVRRPLVPGKLMTALLAVAVLAVGCFILMDHSDESDAAEVASGSCGDNLQWSVDTDGILTITGSGDMEKFPSWQVRWGGEEIRSVILSSGLTSISQYAFMNCTSLTSVTIPDTVVSIGDSAFKGCSSLATIVFADGSQLTSIGNNAFEDCGPIVSLEFPSTLKTLGNYAFYGCETLVSVDFGNGSKLSSIGVRTFQGCKLLETLTVPDTVSTIGQDAFRECSSLSAVNFGSGSNLITLSDGAFQQCTSLEEVTIPDTVRTLGSYAFASCSSLESAYIGNNVKIVDSHAFEFCGNLQNLSFGDNSILELINVQAFSHCSSLVSIVVPSTVKTLYYNAFSHCGSLTTVVFVEESELTTVESAFTGCTSLSAITLPDSVETIGDSAFSGCTSLASMVMPVSLLTIGSGSFYNCTALGSVSFANGCKLDSIGYSAFCGCTSLRSICLPDMLTSLGSNVFMDCVNLNYLVLPSSVSSIGVSAFEGCYHLFEVVNLSALSISVGSSSPGYAGYYATYVHRDKANPVIRYADDGSTYAIYDGVYYLISYTDESENRQLPQNIENHDYILGKFVFYGDTALKTVDIPKSVMAIDNYAFYGCSELTAVNFDQDGKMKSIGTNAFRECTSLPSVAFPESLSDLGHNSFSGCDSIISISIPASVRHIGLGVFADCSNLTAISVAEANTEYCSKDGVLFDKAKKTLVQYPASKSIIDYTIPDSVISVGEYAFYGCSSLATVTVSKSVVDIKYNAFQGCGLLSSVVFESGSSLERIGERAFTGCVQLSSIDIPSTVTYVGSLAFNECSNLGSVRIGNGIDLPDLGLNVFYDCTSLKTVYNDSLVYLKIGSTDMSYLMYYADTLNGDVLTSTVGDFTLTYNTYYHKCRIDGYRGSDTYLDLTTLEIESETYYPVEIVDRVFREKTSLVSVIIPDTVVRMGLAEFINCSNLQSVVLSNSLTELKDDVFYGCARLETINLPESLETLGREAFRKCTSLETVTLGEGSHLVTIGDYAFDGCVLLESFMFPDSLITVGSYAFNGCAVLSSADFKEEGNLESIGEYAFSGCASLGSVTFSDSLVSIGAHSFEGCSAVPTLRLPGSVEVIGDYAFSGWNGITVLVIPGSVTYLGEYAFSKCKTVESVSFEYNDHLISVSKGLFKGCSGLTSVDFGGNSIETISNSAFSSCSSLSAIDLPNSVVTIDNSAFMSCRSLGILDLSGNANLETIGISAFSGCSNLTMMVLPGSLKTISEHAFYDAGLTTIAIPDSVISIGQYAFGSNQHLISATFGEHSVITTLEYRMFSRCLSLVDVKLPNSLTTLGEEVFYGCTSLSEIHLPGSLTFLNTNTFYGCESLIAFDVNDENTKYSSEEGILYTKDKTWLILYPMGKKESQLVIPNTVSTIGSDAFNQCNYLTSIVLPNSLTSIKSSAVSGCRSLFEIINLSDLSITKGANTNGAIAYYAMNVFTSMEDSTIRVVDEDYVFGESEGTSYLLKYFGDSSVISLPQTTDSDYQIYGFAFKDMSFLRSVTIPSRVIGIGTYAFVGCTSIENIVIPSSVTEIQVQAFGGFKFYDTDEVTELESTAEALAGFRYVGTKDKMVRAIASIRFNTGGAPAIPPITGIAGNPVSEPDEPVWDYHEFLGWYADSGYNDPYVFTSLPDMTVTVYAKWKAIEYLITFDDGNRVTSIQYTADDSVFTEPVVTELYGKSGSWEAYVLEYNDTQVVHAVYTTLVIGGQCGDSLSWEYNDDTSTLTISGTGEMYDYDNHGGPWCGYVINSLVVEPGVTSIGDCAFDECTTLKSVSLPTTLERIGDFAFCSCTSLTTVRLPNSISIIEYSVFSSCYSLESVNLPDSLTVIDFNLFLDCRSLTNICIPKNVTEVTGSAFGLCTSLTEISVADRNTSFVSVDGVLFNADKTVLVAYPAGKTDSEYTIPDTVEIVSGSSFYGCKYLDTVIIPSSVKTIKQGAFQYSSLETVEIPDSVESLESYVFDHCASLKSILLSESITKIDIWTFGDCISLEAIVIPQSVTSIESAAFSGCCSLHTVALPSNLTYIGSSAFRGCSSLVTVTIPGTVETIDTLAFEGCLSLFEVINQSNLEIVKGSEDNGYVGYYAVNILSSVDDATVGLLDNKFFYGRSGDVNYLVKYIGNEQFLTLPESINGGEYVVRSYAIYFHHNLLNIVLPPAVVAVEDCAFESCNYVFELINESSISFEEQPWGGAMVIMSYRNLYTSMDCSTLGIVDGKYIYGVSKGITYLLSYLGNERDVVLPDTINGGDYEIIDCVFEDRDELESVTIPDSVTAIGAYAFSGCTSLQTVILPDSIVTIGDNAFSNCVSLETVTLGSSLTTINAHAFGSCISLATIHLTSSVESVFGNTFYGCTSLQSVTVEDSNKEYCSVGGVLFSKDKTCLILYPAGRSESSYSIPDTVNTIGANAFAICESLNTAIIPDSVRVISEEAFHECVSLKVITIPSAVLDMKNAFLDCIHLKAVINRSLNPIAAGNDTYTGAGMYADRVIGTVVQDYTVGDYVIDYNELSGICRIKSYTGNETSLDLGTLSLGFRDYTIQQISENAFSSCTGLTDLVIGDSILRIGINAFSGCPLVNVTIGNSIQSLEAFSFDEHLKSVVVGDSITQVGRWLPDGFTNCPNLETVVLGNSVTEIGSWAFQGCTSLTNITIGNSVLTICPQAFYGCISLKTIVIPDSVTSIGWLAFSNCTSLTTVTMGDGVRSIGASAFEECTALRNVRLSNSLETMDVSVFRYCRSLESIVLPDSLTVINEADFNGCIALKSLILGNNVTAIRGYAFAGCESIISITLPESLVQIEPYAFQECFCLFEVINLSDLEIPSYSVEDGGISNYAMNVITSPEDSTVGMIDDSFVYGSYEGVNYLLRYIGNDSEVSLPDSINGGEYVIRSYAFHRNTSISTITVPESVCRIEGMPFDTDNNITTVNASCRLGIYPGSYSHGYIALNATTVNITHSLILDEAVDATCGAEGHSAYHYCKYCSYSEQPIWYPRLPHDYTVEFVWAEDGSECTVNLVCSRDPNHSVSDWGDIQSSVKVEPTCVTMGITTYTASIVDMDGVEHSDSIDIQDIGVLDHSYVDEVHDPTCTEQGLTTHICSVCGDSFTDSYIGRLGHDLQYHSGKDPTCTEDGWNGYYTCSRCDYSTYQVLPALGHNPITDDAVVPTCTDTGLTEGSHCSVCGTVLVSQETVDALGHDLHHHDAKAPTCTEIGWDAYDTCSRCDHTTYLEKSALGHDYQVTVISPKCEEQGFTVHTCSVCGNIYRDSYTPAIGHDMHHHNAKDPTCTEIGWEAYDTCPRCGYTTYQELSVIEHRPVTDDAIAPTCTGTGLTEGSHCSVCGTVLVSQETVDALGHNLHHHDAKAPTCTEIGWDAYDTCSRCSYTTYQVLLALGHKYVPIYDWAPDGSSCRVIVNCTNDPAHGGTAIGTVTRTVKVPSTCTAWGTTAYTVSAVFDGRIFTDVKEIADIEPTGHDYSATFAWSIDGRSCDVILTCGNEDSHKVSLSGDVTGSVKAAPTCTVMGITMYRVTVTYEGIEYSDTKDVQDITVLGHRYKDTVTAPTCTEGGFTTHICEICQDTYEDGYTDALGHSYSPKYQWSADGKSCTVELICANDASHVRALLGTVTSSVKVPAVVSMMGITTYSVAVTYDGVEYTDTKDVQDIPALEPEIREEQIGDETVYTNIVVENQTTKVTDIFTTAKTNSSSVEVSVPTAVTESPVTIAFNNDAVNAIGDNDVTLTANLVEESEEVSDAELVLEVRLDGATFSEGKAKVTIPFNGTVPAGKIVKVYFINGDQRQDMHATLAGGNLIFETDHFSTYAVVIEDAPSDSGSGGMCSMVIAAAVAMICSGVAVPFITRFRL